MIPFLTFIFVMVVTAILFGSWVVVSIIRMVWGTIFRSRRGNMPPMVGRQCMNSGCRSGNPMHAHFCRRCGANLSEVAMTNRMNQPQPRYNPNNGRGRQFAGI
jgi:hypothetical protein